MNFRPERVLLTVRRSVQVLVAIKGQRYRGRLVRAFRAADGMTACGVAPEQLIETSWTPHGDGTPVEVSLWHPSRLRPIPACFNTSHQQSPPAVHNFRQRSLTP